MDICECGGTEDPRPITSCWICLGRLGQSSGCMLFPRLCSSCSDCRHPNSVRCSVRDSVVLESIKQIWGLPGSADSLQEVASIASDIPLRRLSYFFDKDVSPDITERHVHANVCQPCGVPAADVLAAWRVGVYDISSRKDKSQYFQAINDFLAKSDNLDVVVVTGVSGKGGIERAVINGWECIARAGIGFYWQATRGIYGRFVRAVTSGDDAPIVIGTGLLLI